MPKKIVWPPGCFIPTKSEKAGKMEPVMEQNVFQRKRAGRKTKYRRGTPQLAYRLALLGLTDKELARALGVGYNTLKIWKMKHPKFKAAIKNGKVPADAKVARALYQRATGYSHPDIHITVIHGEVIITPITKHYPPDTGAAIFWLKSRQGWREVQTHEHTGRDGKPIEVQSASVDLSELTKEELLVAKKMNMALKESKEKVKARA